MICTSIVPDMTFGKRNVSLFVVEDEKMVGSESFVTE
jgi:hypothetical protein